MARLGRRQSFKPILSGLIQYQPAPAVPGNVKRVIVSFAAKQSATAFRVQRPRVLLCGLIKYAVPSPVGQRVIVSYAARLAANTFRTQQPRFLLSRRLTTPMPAGVGKVNLFLKVSVNTAAQRPRTRIVKAASLVAIPVVTPIPRVRPKIKIKHDEARIGSRGRGHEQQVSAIINELGRSGELIGSVSDPALGYLASDPSAVGTTEVLAISEVLDRIIAYIKSQNGTGI